jgi:hypothetical protein
MRATRSVKARPVLAIRLIDRLLTRTVEGAKGKALTVKT